MDHRRASYRVDLGAKTVDERCKDAWDAAVSDYPDLRDPTSVFHKTAERLTLEARDPNHPDHHETLAPESPRFFSDKAAWELGRPVINGGVVMKPAEVIPGIPRFYQHPIELSLSEAFRQLWRALRASL
jgi:hypothetical protein